MKKFAKLAMTGVLLATAAVGVGCTSGEKASETPAATEQPAKKDDVQKQYQAAFAAAMIAESQLVSQFEDKKGLEGGKEVAYPVGKTTDEAVAFLSTNYWSKEVAQKEYEAVLGDAAVVEKANAAFKAKAVADKKEADFKPVTIVADSAKLGSNSLAKGNFADAKVEEKDGKFVIDYKGLKYTMEKNNNSYRVVGKEGTLQK